VTFRGLAGRPTEFPWTELLPGGACGEAKWRGRATRIEIDAKFRAFEGPPSLDLIPETYVLWAVSPQGRAVNLREVVRNQGAGHVKGPSRYQTWDDRGQADPMSAAAGERVVLEM